MPKDHAQAIPRCFGILGVSQEVVVLSTTSFNRAAAQLWIRCIEGEQVAPLQSQFRIIDAPQLAVIREHRPPGERHPHKRDVARGLCEIMISLCSRIGSVLPS